VAASDWVIAGLTFVLVCATVYYAFQTHAAVEETRKTVNEMRAAREIQVMPKLVPTIEILSPNDLLPRVSNMGVGPAINVRIHFHLEPNGPDATYTAAFMSPGKGQSVFPKTDSGDRIMNVKELAPYDTFHIKGECWDALGTRHEVDERFELKAYIRDFKSGTWARQSRVHRTGEPMKLIADAVVGIEDMMRRQMESA